MYLLATPTPRSQLSSALPLFHSNPLASDHRACLWGHLSRLQGHRDHSRIFKQSDSLLFSALLCLSFAFFFFLLGNTASPSPHIRSMLAQWQAVHATLVRQTVSCYGFIPKQVALGRHPESTLGSRGHLGCTRHPRAYFHTLYARLGQGAAHSIRLGR